MSRVLLLPVSFVVVVMAGCHHAPRALRLEGSSTFTFIEPPPQPATPKPKAEVSDDARQVVEALLVAAPIQPLAKPQYPAAALGRETLPVTIGVRILVDAQGRVADVRTSPTIIATPTPRTEEFRAAIEDAVAQWRFRSAELRQFAPSTDANGAPAWALVSREKTDYAFDVAFVFQATGEVMSPGLK